ncbi:MAG: Wzz/FepE/Etk N-terminal domain-containing protein [Clostridiales bacterium]|nr:Wzz/FepE/Etk N-terminal domain-containing protein [Clostridiales bacterium]
MNANSYQTEPQMLDTDTIEIDISALFRALLKHAWLIIAVTLFFGCAGYMVTKLAVTPTYQTSFSIYINNSTLSNINTITSSDVTASQYLAETGADVINSNNTRNLVAEAVGLESEDISISTSVKTESGVIQVSVVTTAPKDAYDCGVALVDIAAEEIARVVEGSSVQVIDIPELPTGFYRPNYLKNVFLCMVAGAVLTCGLIVVRELLDDKVKSREDVENHFNLVNLGAIPDITGAQGGKYEYYAGYGAAARGNRKTN